MAAHGGDPAPPLGIAGDLLRRPYIFLVGDRPVIVAWGYEKDSAHVAAVWHFTRCVACCRRACARP